LRLVALGQEIDAKTKKKQVRGGAVVAFLLNDPGGVKIERALVCNRPVQHYLNACFAADKTTNTFTRAVLQLPIDVTEEPAELIAARKEAIRNNVKPFFWRTRPHSRP